MANAQYDVAPTMNILKDMLPKMMETNFSNGFENAHRAIK